ncbi:MAG TPA: hypothetical protein VM658_18730 [bacterium]|nr:hypothetical protein [bacterium]
MTEASQKALSILRDPTQFSWYVVPIFVLVLYVYTSEIEKRNWNIILAGLAFWGMDWFNEIWNGLILHFTGRSAFWTTPGHSAYVILIGLNVEITLMFAILGIVCIKMLPQDKNLKVLGIPNRWFFAVTNSVLCVIVEIVLNALGALVWEYPFWNFPNVILIFLIGYLPFMAVSFWVHDMTSRRRQLAVLAVIFGVDIIGIALFMGLLHWI